MREGPLYVLSTRPGVPTPQCGMPCADNNARLRVSIVMSSIENVVRVERLHSDNLPRTALRELSRASFWIDGCLLGAISWVFIAKILKLRPKSTFD